MKESINFNDWSKATYQSCDDPIEFNGNNRSCKLCDKDAENMDEFCENHQRCIMCGDNEDCICEEEFSNVSNCCEAVYYDPSYPDNTICSACGEHSISAWDEARDNKKNTN